MLSISRLKCLPAEAIFKNVRSHLKTIRCTLTDKTKTPEQLEQEAKKAAKKRETHIALIQPDQAITYITLEDATKLATRRNLKLIKISDYDKKRESPVYRAMTAVQYREEALSLKKTKTHDKTQPYKGEKLVAINSKIAEHDLEGKIVKMLSWLEKNYEIRVTIAGSTDQKSAENVFSKIEEMVSNKGRILQKRCTGSDIKFQMVPPKRTPNSENKSS